MQAPALLACLALAASTAAADQGFTVTERDDRVVITVDGQAFTEYRFRDTPRPYFHPLLGPGGVPLTRSFPMSRERTDEDQDHPHHRSLWYAHGDVNGVDFWADGPQRGRIEHVKVLEARGGADEGVLRTASRWVKPDGALLLTDERTFRVHRGAGPGRWFDFSITLTAPPGLDVTLGDTKEGTMALRLAESMRFKPNKHYAGKPAGTIRQDTGATGGDTWGRRAKWTDYSGPVADAGGRIFGITIYDHPQNPRYPTWWHVRDYGLFAANPFGVHDFEKKPAGTGDLKIPAGQGVTFKYRFHLHEGGEAAAKGWD